MFNIYQVTHRPAGVSEVNFTVFVQGSEITINDEAFDFSFMEKGSTLPVSAISSERFAADVVCDDDGVINITLVTPIGPNATEAEIHPAPLTGKKYGKVIDIHIPAVEVAQQEVANG